MSLQVWLPLNGDLHNQGLGGNLAVANSGATVDNNGKIGKCYSFNGSSDYLRFLYPASNLQGEWSFSCWVKINNITSKFTLLSSRKTTGAGMSIFILAGKIRFDNGSDSANSQTQFTTSLTASIWQHITLVQTATQRKFYLNGILKETLNGNALSSGNTAQYILVGACASADTTPTDNWLNGYLNDVRIYDHALSPKEVEEIAKGLVLHYKLDSLTEGQTIIYDSSGYSNNGTIVGSLTAAAGSPRYDAATYIDGTGPYINSNNNFSFLNESPFTISIWVYCEDWAAATASTSRYIIQNYNSTNGGFRIWSSSGTNRYRIYWIDTDETAHSFYFSANNALTSGWAFFTATYDGTTMKTYLNGNYYTSETYSFKSTTSAPNLLVGNGAASVPGNYSDFRIYATALTAEQVKELYNTSMSVDSNGNIHARELSEL